MPKRKQKSVASRTSKQPVDGANNSGADARLVPALLRWYRQHRRDLPWRRLPDNAYAQMLAEMMLQQTQVATVISYFERFMERFPTLRDLAAADINDVLTLWSGLGYYSRARNLHAAAKQIVAEHAGRVPADVATLMTLPGIGRYTAGAIASIAYGTQAAVVDGNVIRVLMRVLAIDDDDPKSPKLHKRLWEVAESLVPANGVSGAKGSKGARGINQASGLNHADDVSQASGLNQANGLNHAGDFNQGMMELGSLVCRPQSPACPTCPIRKYCGAHRERRVDEIPPPSSRTAVKAAEYVVAAVRCGPRLLFVQRPMTGLWAGLWELPSEEVVGGKMGGVVGGAVKGEVGGDIKGESISAARARLRERLSAICGRLPAGFRLATQASAHVPWQLSHRRLTFHVFVGQLPAIGLQRAAVQGRWLSLGELDSVGISAACRAIIEAIS